MQGERVRALLPARLRQSVFGTLGRYYPKADWAPRPLRAKSTLLELAGEGGEAYAASVGVTPHALRQRPFSADMKARLGASRAADRFVTTMAEAPARDRPARAPYADLRICLPGERPSCV